MASSGYAVGFLLNLANTLGIPLGAKRKVVSNPLTSNKSKKEDPPSQLAVIAEITRDDICLTDKPFFYNSSRLRLGKILKSKLDVLTMCLNKIVRSVAFDLLVDGYSVYKLCEKNNEYYFEPLLGDLDFYLVDNKVLAVKNNKVLGDLLIFINYEKRDLEEATLNENLVLKIIPKGFQSRYTKDLIDKLKAAEDSVSRLRAQTRYIRFATVEVGINKGDQQQDVM